MDSSETDTTGPADTVDEVERLRRDLHDEKQHTLRVRADYDNLRKRAEREREAAQPEGRRAALRAILPVLDALERAVKERDVGITTLRHAAAFDAFRSQPRFQKLEDAVGAKLWTGRMTR